MVPSMLVMRRVLRPLTEPALLALDRLPPRRRERPRPPAMVSRPLPWMPGRSRARLMLARMRPMLAQLRKARRR
ncbi:MAG: hypothetical protein KF723_23020 [Rhizobiaceae bacterium]|nr:hypothetical protein [Rhizobiaceae bacterium]